MVNSDDIVEKWGLPRDHVSCPSCGELYGTKNRKACKTCEECSKCCTCPPGEKRLVTADELVAGLK
jgi:hypothetical protein